jgi:hypothetical protein
MPNTLRRPGEMKVKMRYLFIIIGMIFTNISFSNTPKCYKVRLTIAKTCSMILILACALRPFLPSLSQNIISLFGKVDESTINKIYQGDIYSIKEIYKINLSPVKMPKALVPKIVDYILLLADQSHSFIF